MSKKLITLLITFFICLITFAQQGINYKALIKDKNGNVVANQGIDMVFSIQIQGNTVYSELQQIVTDSTGIAIATIGEGSAITGIFDAIDWRLRNLELNIQIDFGDGLIDFGNSPFNAVPYAINTLKPQGLEAIDQGNGIGWRLATGVDTGNYGPIGGQAVDFSFQGFPINRGATGLFSFASGAATLANASYSVAFGEASSSTGEASFSSGSYSIASASNATAMGQGTEASGNNSFAIGNNTEASGFSSTAIGSSTLAESYISTAIGRYNVGGGNPTSWVESNPILEIGNGSSNSSRRNALTILKDGSILQHNSLNTYDELVGTGAVAFGNESNAAGDYSFTSGTNNETYGDFAIALGTSNTASGENSISVGQFSVTSGESSAAFGRNSMSQGNYAFAAGYQARALGEISISLGQDNYSSGTGSVSIGSFNNARSINSLTIGAGLESNVRLQTVLGRYNEPWPTDLLSIWGSELPLIIIGNGRSDSERSNALTILGSGFTGIGVDNPQERLHINGALRIGNETIEDGGSDILAFSSSLVPSVDEGDRLGGPNRKWLDVYAANGTIQTSDRRSKMNIANLNYGLYEVLQMQPVSFNWKNKNNPDTKLGLIAQDLQTLIPEVVHAHIWEKDEATGRLTKKELDRLGVYYSDLVPVLINAIKEQQKIIDNEKSINSIQKLQLEALLSRMDQLESKSLN